LKFSFDFGDVLFSDDMRGLAWHECLFEAQPPMEWKLLIILDDLYSTGALPTFDRGGFTTAVVTLDLSCLNRSLSFAKSTSSTHTASPLFLYLYKNHREATPLVTAAPNATTPY